MIHSKCSAAIFCYCIAIHYLGLLLSTSHASVLTFHYQTSLGKSPLVLFILITHFAYLIVIPAYIMRKNVKEEESMNRVKL